MTILIINTNPIESNFDIELSELIYSIESLEHDVINVVLRNIGHSKAELIKVHALINASNLVIYATSIASDDTPSELDNFLRGYYFDKHPNIIVVLESAAHLTTESIESLIDYFEAFAKEHDSKIIDIQYLNEIKIYLSELLNII